MPGSIFNHGGLLELMGVQDGVSKKTASFLRFQSWFFLPGFLAISVGFFGYLIAGGWGNPASAISIALGSVFFLGVGLLAYHAAFVRQRKIERPDIPQGEKWVSEFETEEVDDNPDNSIVMRPVRLIITDRRMLVEYPSFEYPLPLIRQRAIRSTEWSIGIVPIPLSDVLRIEKTTREEPVLTGERRNCIIVSLRQFGPVEVVSKPDTPLGRFLVSIQKSATDRVYYFPDLTTAGRFATELDRAVKSFKTASPTARPANKTTK